MRQDLSGGCLPLPCIFADMFFADKPEFTWIAALLGTDASGGLRRDALGPGDDACLTPLPDGSFEAISVDASVEGVHYRLDWVSPPEALLKALLSNLSDINAMGGKTRQLYLTLGASPSWGLAEAEAMGTVLREAAERYGFAVAGGDTVRLPQGSFMAITVVGKVVGRPLLRSAARPGHKVYVSGHLGLSSMGLEVLQREGHALQGLRESIQSAMATDSRGDSGWDESRPQEAGSEGQSRPLSGESLAVLSHLLPQPPLNLGPALAAMDRDIAAIDISDGLSSELWHLSRQSACRMEVAWSKLPMHPLLREWRGSESMRSHVLHGGEEYQLVFTGDFSEGELQQLNRHALITEIGVVKAGEGVWLLDDMRLQALPAGGYSH